MQLKILSLIIASIIAAPTIASPYPTDIVVERQVDVPTARVIVTRADFVSPQSRRALDHRIRDAIESVCGSYATIESYQVPGMDHCWNRAHGQVSSQLQIAQARGQGLIQLAAR